MRKLSRRGFTLIELLVVIEIIALLAAILFPVFARARENARRSTCQSNLKQMLLGVHQYIQDYDEHFPLSGGNGGGCGTTPAAGNYGSGLSWAMASQSYIKSTQIFKCPSDTTANSISYGNNCLLDNNCAGTNLGSQNISVVQAVSQTIMWYEDQNNDAQWNTLACHDFTKWFHTAPYYAYLAHFDGSNIGLADGHVKWFKIPASAGGTVTQMGITWDPKTSP